MAEKQAEVDEITRHYTEELEQLRAAQEHFEAVEVTYQDIIRERQLLVCVVTAVGGSFFPTLTCGWGVVLTRCSER